MHRIPLKLSTPSISWERTLPETILIERTLNQCNVKETCDFILILDDEVKISDKFCEEYMKNHIEIVNGLMSTDAAQAVGLLNISILRAPKDSEVLSSALILRGRYFLRNNALESAIRDYEMFLYGNKAEYKELLDICEAYGYLTVIHYLMRKYRETIKYLALFRSHRGKSKLSEEELEDEILLIVENHIAQFKHELENFEEHSPLIPIDVFRCTPFKGFSSNNEIPHLSAACEFGKATHTKGRGGVYSNCPIPKHSVIMVENPLSKEVHTPLVACEYCCRQGNQNYTCFECRYKIYCSLRCLEEDKSQHEMECSGYRNLLLLILDACGLYRMFIRISKILHEHVFGLKPFRKLQTADDIFEKMQSIVSVIESCDSKYLKLLGEKPDFKKLSHLQFATVVATASRLTIFTEMKTNIMKAFYKKLHISNKQKMILIGAILMRLHCHMLQNTYDIEFKVLKRHNQVLLRSVGEYVDGVLLQYTKPDSKTTIHNIEAYYNIDYEEDIIKRANALLQNYNNERSTRIAAMLPKMSQTEPCRSIIRPISVFKDNIAEMFFQTDTTNAADPNLFMKRNSPFEPNSTNSGQILSESISQFNDLSRCCFVRKFASNFHVFYISYFLKLNSGEQGINQVYSVFCTSLNKFNHSCEPNMQILVLDNGVVIAKTLRNINKGEELVCSFKADNMRHTRVERRIFLKRHNIICHCTACTGPEFDEPTNLRQGVICECSMDQYVTPIDEKCQHCRKSYNDLLLSSHTALIIFEDTLYQYIIARGSERDIYIQYRICYEHVCRSFDRSSENFIRVALKFAEFLALKNFGYQTYDIVWEVRANVIGYYNEDFLWFSFYADILNIIKIILHYNVDKKIFTLPGARLCELCNYGLYIIEGQKTYLQMNETFDAECTHVIYDYRKFLKWKEVILCDDIIPFYYGR